MREHPTGFELDAYLDGELDGERRLAVEHYLAHRPEAAAQLMEDMSVRTALRLAQAPLDDHAGLAAVAARLDDRLARKGTGFWPRPRWLVAAMLVAALATGALWLPDRVHMPAAPIYVADAVEAYRTGLLRATMISQVETPRFDAHDVQRYTRIRVPVLPRGWSVTDVQIFPSDEGPALQIMIRTGDRKTVSIFAVRSAAQAPLEPVTVQRGDATVAYWRTGDMAYALTGAEAPAALMVAARDLANNRIS
jgi:anti-sigma factor RsiW